MLFDAKEGEAVLEAAFSWPCKRRVDYTVSADVWTVRFRWTELKPQLRRDLLDGQCMDTFRTAKEVFMELGI